MNFMLYVVKTNETIKSRTIEDLKQGKGKEKGRYKQLNQCPVQSEDKLA